MKVNTWKVTLSKLLFAVMVLLSIAIITPTVAFAASTPVLTKTSCNVLVGKKYDINVKNGIAKSTYAWSTSDKKVATVDKNGVIKGIGKGTAYITCKVKTPKKVYTLRCTVAIIKPATSVEINNKVTILNVGQKYDLNRTLTPASSNDKTAYTSSNTKIASPDKYGRFKALKEGTVMISATTLSGEKDTVKIKVVDKNGTVSTQSQLNAILGSGASLITIQTSEAAVLSIPAGDFSKQKLVVDAPNADITNAGKFASINIKQIKSDTWVEKAAGNVIAVSATGARIVIAEGASVSIEATTKGAVIKVENNGTVEELALPEGADIEIAGTSKQAIPIAVAVPGIKIKSSVPLDLDCKQKIDLTLKKGAENTKIQVESKEAMPTIAGNVTIPVTVGKGADAKVEEIKGTPIKEDNVGGGAPIIGGGTPGGNQGNNNPPTTTLTFDVAISNISAFNYIRTGGSTPSSIDSQLLAYIKTLLTDEDAGAIWRHMDLLDGLDGSTDGTYHLTYSGGSIAFTNLNSNAKTVTLQSGREYTVTYTENSTSSSVTVTNSNNLSVVFTKNANNTFSIATGLSISDIGQTQTFEKLCDVFTSISVNYNSQNYDIDIPQVENIRGYINSEVQGTKADNWEGLGVGISGGVNRTYGGQPMNIAATSVPATKTVTFVNAPFSNKVYTVTVDDHSNTYITITITYSSVTATINMNTGEMAVSFAG